MNFEQRDYQGGKSTLCTGCGHDSVTNQIIKAYFEAGVAPYKIAKISGIGCSSKTPAYFINQAHGFNTVHGRMAAVATGAKLANRNLEVIGISGDGDTASIGLGGFLHLVRRNLPMVYIVENNGVYGLTKGQFSATADDEMRVKSGDKNIFGGLDLCALAINSGCGFVARAFSGDSKQLLTLLKAAIEHPGTAVIDAISPCITYANHDGSTLSYDYVKEHKVSLQELGFILETKAPESEAEPGERFEIALASGKVLQLRKLAHKAHDISNRSSALAVLNEAQDKHEILTGLIYHSLAHKPLVEALQLAKKPLAGMTHADLLPLPGQWQEILNAFR